MLSQPGLGVFSASQTVATQRSLLGHSSSPFITQPPFASSSQTHRNGVSPQPPLAKRKRPSIAADGENMDRPGSPTKKLTDVSDSAPPRATPKTTPLPPSKSRINVPSAVANVGGTITTSNMRRPLGYFSQRKSAAAASQLSFVSDRWSLYRREALKDRVNQENIDTTEEIPESPAKLITPHAEIDGVIDHTAQWRDEVEHENDEDMVLRYQ